MSRRAQWAGIGRGIARCAIGRADGLDAFAATTAGFTGSLAPLLALPLVGALLRLTRGQPVVALADLLGSVCVLLAPPVISELLARAQGRQASWLRYAVAYNWCQWVLPPLGLLLLLVFGVAGLSPAVGVRAAVLALMGYWIWLHWFLVRRGLGLPPWRAALTVLAINGGTGLLLALPMLFG